MERHLPFRRAVNFRDMGGYLGHGGKRTRWRHLFRSGHLHRVTEEDLAQLAELKIARIYDFRDHGERAKEPDKAPAACSLHHLPIEPRTPHSMEDMIAQWAAGTLSPADITAAQDDTYRQYMQEHPHQYRALFEGILAGGGQPILIHCAGGKDRTGMGAALILAALGVEEETIHADYWESTGSYSLTRYIQSVAARHKTRQDMFDEAMHLFGVKRERMQRGLDAARETGGGSLDGYLAKSLGVGEAERAQLRAWYLE